MDLSNEVCATLKTAIKARLKELGIIWDRELPDYVMVLIKNKKSKEQMENDLNIFLGSHTIDFTNWLHEVWKKLEACTTVSTRGIKKKDEEKKTKIKRRTSDENQFGSKKSRSIETHSDLKDDSDTDIRSVCSQSLQGQSPVYQNENGYRNHLTNDNKEQWEKSFLYSSEDKEEPRKPRERIEIKWSEEKSRENGEGLRTRRERSRSGRSRSRSKSRHRSRSSSRPPKDGGLLRGSKDGGRYNERSGSREKRGVTRDAREFIRSRSSQERATRNRGKPTRNRYEQERNTKNLLKDKNEEKLPSLVKVTPRPVRPAGMQPSSSLILKAVADAQKSIAITSLPQPEDKLGHNDDNNKPVRKKPMFKKKIGSGFEPNISITLLNDRISSNTVAGIQETVVESTTDDNRLMMGPEVQRFTISLQSDDDSMNGSDHEDTESNNLESNEFEQKLVEQIQVENTQLPEPEPMDTSSENPVGENEVSEYPVYRFDRSRLGPRIIPVVPDSDTVLSCLVSSSQITKTIVNESAFSECSETKSDENDKLIKCKFWPSCEAGESCRFYHPKTYCRTLPNCKFGQKCLFIHPPCKFGEQCLNVTCPYVHKTTVASSTNTPPVAGKVWTKVPLAPSNGQICMFFPNCTKPFCPYQHYAATPGSGIPCKYGVSCTKLSCEFDHPHSPKNPYKWVAQNPE